MEGKIIISGKEAIEKLQKGVNELANAVGSTLGPKGRNVIIPSTVGTPHVTKDGVTVARAISFADESENAGAQLVKDVASKVVEDAGDGTTTATVLAQAIINEGYKQLAAGANPIFIKKGIDCAVKDVVEAIEKMSEPVGDDYGKILNVATISSNNDGNIGNIVTKAMQMVKNDGIVTVEAGNANGEMDIRYTEGMQIDKGFLNGLFVTNPEELTAEYASPNVLIVDDSINTAKDLVDILNFSIQTKNKPLVILAHDVTGDALQMLLINRLKTNLAVLAVKAPNFGEGRTAILEDIATLTGSTVISPKYGMKLASFDPGWFGTCSKVTSTKDSTLFIDGAGNKEVINARIDTLKVQIENTDDQWDREQMQKRLAKLAGGAAVIEVNAVSEVEMKEKRDRVDDALAATRAAIQEGTVIGGGCAFAKIAFDMENPYLDNQEEHIGYKIIKKAIVKPLLTICQNAGVSGEVVLEKVQHNGSTEGYNALTGQYENLQKSGVIDPAKVLRVAIQNAASVAGTLLTTACIIATDENSIDKNNSNISPMGMM